MVCKYFSPFRRLPLHFVYFAVQKLFSLMQSLLLIFAFVSCAFGLISKKKNTAWSKILQPCFLHKGSCPLLPQPPETQSWAPALLSPDIRSVVRTMILLNVKICSLSGSKVLHCCPAKKHSCFFGQRSNWNLNKKKCAVEKHFKHTF